MANTGVTASTPNKLRTRARRQTVIQLVDYTISLSSGGRITIVELDSGRVPELHDQEVLVACRGILNRCTIATRTVLEEAKKGYDKELLRVLRAPDGGLMRAEPHVCRLIQDCAMAVPDKCTLRNLRRGRPNFPQCWEYDPPDGLSEPVRRAAIEIGTAVGNAWREWAYPILVDLDASALRTLS